jgi:hypothetical protein
MVSRGHRRHNRSEREDEEEENEDIVLQTNPTAEEAARIREAQYLAQEALRLAREAREAARRLNEYKARIAIRYRRGNAIDVDDTSTLREGDDSCRTL